MTRWLMSAVALVAPMHLAAQRPSKDTLAGLGFRIVEPMSPAQTLKTRAKVDATLAKAGASDLFDNVTDGKGGKAKHRPSGLVCPLGDKGQRIVSATTDGAACETRDGDTIYRTSVVRGPEGTTLQSAAAARLSEAQAEPGYAPYQGPSVQGHPRAGSGLPDHQTIRFVSRAEGHTRTSTEQVGVIRGWILTERKIAPDVGRRPPMMGDLLAESTFGTSMTTP